MSMVPAEVGLLGVGRTRAGIAHTLLIQGATVKDTTVFHDPDVPARGSRGLGEAMLGINANGIPHLHRPAERGW